MRQAREAIGPTAVAMGVVSESVEMVASGYMVLFELGEGFGKILIVSAYLLSQSEFAVLPLIVFPMAIGASSPRNPLHFRSVLAEWKAGKQ